MKFELNSIKNVIEYIISAIKFNCSKDIKVKFLDKYYLTNELKNSHENIINDTFDNNIQFSNNNFKVGMVLFLGEKEFRLIIKISKVYENFLLELENESINFKVKESLVESYINTKEYHPCSALDNFNKFIRMKIETA